MHTIAVQPDAFVHANGEQQSFSARWTTLAEQAGLSVRTVDAYSPDVFAQLEGCSGFLWRFDFAAPERVFAKRLLMALEQTGLHVFPSWATAWHFEDKIGQHYLLQAAGLPTARTWVFWDRTRAAEFARHATYPLVVKFTSGYQSANVRLARTREETAYWIDRLFADGLFSLDERRRSPARAAAHRLRASLRALAGRPVRERPSGEEWQHGYVYLQEFLPGNAFDTRVTVIGDRAFAFRRFNRPDDFRASGSGRIDWDIDAIEQDAVRLALRAARTLGTQCLAADILRRDGDAIVNEISYTFASWAVRKCPGHWTVSGDPASAPLRWVPGPLAPEDAIFADFVAALDRRVPHAVAQ